MHNIEESKYDGKPLIQPKAPYQFKAKTFEADKTLKFPMRVQRRLTFLQQSAAEYFSDIWHMR